MSDNEVLDLDPALRERLRSAVHADAADAGSTEPDALRAHVAHRRRLHRSRRAGTLATAALVVVLATVLALGGSVPVAAPDLGFAGPSGPPGWQRVEVGGAWVFAPPEWDVWNVEDLPTEDGRQRCPEPEVALLLVALGPGHAHLMHCSEADVDRSRVVMVADLRQVGTDAAMISPEGRRTEVGGQPAWMVPARGTWPHIPRTWVVPSLGLVVAGEDGVTEELRAAVVAREVDPSAVTVGVRHADESTNPNERRSRYFLVDADAQHHTWFTDDDPLLATWTSIDPPPWPAATGHRVAMLEIVDHSLRVVAGRPDHGSVVWSAPDVGAAAGETAIRTGHPNFLVADWSPDGTALVWVAASDGVDGPGRIGVVQWSDADAIVDGLDPVTEQTATIDGPPILIDPPGSSWHWRPDGDRWTLEVWGYPEVPPTPPTGEAAPPRHTYALDLTPGDDGLLDLDDAVRFDDLGRELSAQR